MRDLNPRPLPCEGSVLPAELIDQSHYIVPRFHRFYKVVLKEFACTANKKTPFGDSLSEPDNVRSGELQTGGPEMI